MQKFALNLCSLLVIAMGGIYFANPSPAVAGQPDVSVQACCTTADGSECCGDTCSVDGDTCSAS